MLAAYMRFKFPNIVVGAIAASAPIYQVAGKISGDVFFQAVTKVILFQSVSYCSFVEIFRITLHCVDIVKI